MSPVIETVTQASKRARSQITAASALRQRTQKQTLGWMPLISLFSSLGLLLVVYSYRQSLAGAAWGEQGFWGGMLILLVPAAARLALPGASRWERIGLVLFVGLGLYLVKLVHSPYAFTFSDELIHVYNAQKIAFTHRLFTPNPILSATPYYPGLETLTTALTSLGGLSVFPAGLIVLGLARLVMLLGLFLTYERISRSAYAAGLGALSYNGASNYLFWSVQFSYESLALPLATVFLFLLAWREEEADASRVLGLTSLALLTLLAVVITHHMTSYGLALLLVIYAAASWLTRPRRVAYISPWGLAFIALMATSSWLAFAASQTVYYLSPVLVAAVSSFIKRVIGEESGRVLFQSASGELAPLWERLVGLGSVALIFIALLFGLIQVWQRYRRNTMVVVFAAIGVMYFPILGLRLTPAGWETSNRAANFVFLGVALTLALGIARYWVRPARSWPRILVVSAFAAVIFIGGVISGWLPQLRLPQPYRLGTRDYWVEPQGKAAADWMKSHLGSGNRVAVDESNGRFLLAYGDQYSLTGERGGIRDMLFAEGLMNSDLETLQAGSVQYALLDERRVSWSNMRGIYFPRKHFEAFTPQEWMPAGATSKFDGLRHVSRLFDSGYIAIYDVGVLSGVKTIR
ncbi:MAG TPA: hypothetical protein VJ436_13985 [Anaerolineales bacterium]|nr:hypothetical protein [Anaerolineales bacterium]